MKIITVLLVKKLVVNAKILIQIIVFNVKINLNYQLMELVVQMTVKSAINKIKLSALVVLILIIL